MPKSEFAQILGGAGGVTFLGWLAGFWLMFSIRNSGKGPQSIVMRAKPFQNTSLDCICFPFLSSAASHLAHKAY